MALDVKDMGYQLAAAYTEWASNFCATYGVEPPGGAALQQSNMNYFNEPPDDGDAESSNVQAGTADGYAAANASVAGATDAFVAQQSEQAKGVAQAQGNAQAAAAAQQVAQCSADGAQQEADAASSDQASAEADGVTDAKGTAVAINDADESAQEAQDSAEG